jgi:hypothetical protein
MTICGYVIWIIFVILIFLILFMAPIHHWGYFDCHMRILYWVLLALAFIVLLGPCWGLVIAVLIFFILLIPYCDSFL